MEDGILAPLAAGQEDTIKPIWRGVRSVLALVGDLLELSRAEAGQLKVTTWSAGHPVGSGRLIVVEFSRRPHHARQPRSGLGLTISRWIARLIDGDTQFAARAGGADQRIWLPDDNQP